MYVVRIHICFDLKEEEGKTLITERVQFKSILPVHFFLRSIFRRQHEKLFAAIEKLD
jgi:hypothetical protein